MKFELDTSAIEDADFEDVAPMVPPMTALDDAVASLAVTVPVVEITDLITADGLAVFVEARNVFIEQHKGFVVSSPESLDQCGQIIDTCIRTKTGIEKALSAPINYFHRMHRAWTSLRGDLSGPLEALSESLRSQSTAYRVKVAADEKAAREKAEREARALAEKKKREEDEAARALAAAAAQAAAQAAAELSAANAAGDLDAAMELEAKVEETAAEAYLAQEEAKAVEAAPVVVTDVLLPVPTLDRKAGGSTLVDKYVAECEVDEATTIRAIAAALGARPDLLGLLALDMSAANKIAAALKGEARIPGMRVVNKPYDRRSSAKGK